MARRSIGTKFKEWLLGMDYCIVKGDYPGKFEATDLVPDYLDDNPEDEDFEEEVHAAARKIGFVSQFEWDGPDDEDNVKDQEGDETDESHMFF